MEKMRQAEIRTRIYCLEGNIASLYTTDAVEVQVMKRAYMQVLWNYTLGVDASQQWMSLRKSVSGVMVSIVASQAIDPGSIPGWRNFLFQW